MRDPRSSRRCRPQAIHAAVVCAALLLAFAGPAAAAGPPATLAAAPAFDAEAPHRVLISRHCLGCHNARLKTAGLELDALLDQHEELDRVTWEKVARKLRARQMPPPGRRRPEETAYREALSSLEGELDRIAAETPDPGRTETFRRLNRTEYHNAVRDLLALEVDVAPLLPSDSASFGFDNVTVGDLSPTLLERYVGAAEKISRLAVGRSTMEPVGITFRTAPDLTQEKHVEGLPIGTRGGLLATWNFPADGVYEFSIRLARDRNEHVEGLSEPHDLELLIDREHIETFTVAPPDLMSDVALNYQPSQDDVDDHLVVRAPVTAGPHDVGVTFPARPWVLLETARQPYESHFNYYRHPRVQPAIFSVSIVGPYLPLGAGDTPSRQRIFVCQPEMAAEEDPCAREILASVMRRAYRRPVTGEDVRGPFALYEQAKAESGFEAGIEMGLAAVLVSPEFLFRIERDPAGVEPGAPYRVSDVELASRLAFFLWSSIPDDELLELASTSRLREAGVLDHQVERMLGDPRAENLVTNFAAQWLHLRNLDGVTPDKRLFPDFDDNLRQAMRRETELFVGSVLREDRSALDLVQADYTFLNERLARHYGIPHVYGSRFRRVELRRRQRAGRLAAARQHPDRDLVRHPHLASRARELGAGQPARRAPTAAAARRTGPAGSEDRRQGVARARAAVGPSGQSGLLRLPPSDGPGRLRARELRRDRPLANRRRGLPDRRFRRAVGRHGPGRGQGARVGDAGAPRAVPDDPDREAARVRHRPRRDRDRRPCGARDPAPRGGR